MMNKIVKAFAITFIACAVVAVIVTAIFGIDVADNFTPLVFILIIGVPALVWYKNKDKEKDTFD